MFPIFQAYTMNEVLLETQLIIYLGIYLILGAFLSYIDMLLSSVLVLYS